MALLPNDFPLALSDLANTFGDQGSLRGYLATPGSPTVNVAGPRGFIPASTTDLRLSDFRTSAFADVSSPHFTAGTAQVLTGGAGGAGQCVVTLTFENTGRCTASTEAFGSTPSVIQEAQPIPNTSGNAWTLVGAGGPTIPSSIAANFVIDMTKISGSFPFTNISNFNLSNPISITVIAEGAILAGQPSQIVDSQDLGVSYAIKRADTGAVVASGTVNITATLTMNSSAPQ